MKKTYALLLLATSISVACDGSNDEHTSSSRGVTPSKDDALPAARQADFDESCLTKTIPDGYMIQALVDITKLEAMAEESAKNVVDTKFRGMDVKKVTLYDRAAFIPDALPLYTDVYLDPHEMLFPLGVIQWEFDPGISKYRRFEYHDRVTGKMGTPTLLGMKVNESRSLTLIEFNETRPDADPDSRQGHLDDASLDTEARRTHLTVQYLGRESITARETRYENACKLKLRYDYAGNIPLVRSAFEGTLWLAAGAGPVKFSGATILGIDTITAESAIVPVGQF